MSEKPSVPSSEPPASRIGVDSWVAESESRRARTPGALLGQGWQKTPDAIKLLAFVAFAASYPFWVANNGDLFIFGVITLLYASLGMGLNVVVGFSGLLDLGYVAFYGIGTYTYAELSSPQYNIHWPAEVTIPIAMAVAALVSLFLGFVSRRLLGDYLAIVTLFFGQAFVFFLNPANPNIAGKGFTGGADGLPNVDPIDLFGWKLASMRQLYFLLLVVLTLLAIGIHFANQSRVGRAWRALREDPLAAEVMSIPVNRLKILAFAVGASIAGLCGAIHAAINTAAISGDFDVSVLIIFYAIVILGGLGSISGVFVGAIIINCVLEFLEPSNGHPSVKRWLFYGTIVLLVLTMKPVIRPVIVLAATVGFGFAVHAIVAATLGSSWTTGIPGGSPFNPGASGGATWINHWAIVPVVSHGNFNDCIYIGLLLAVITAGMLKGWWRMAALVPTIYLAVIAWENLLAQNSAITAYLLFGAMLVGLMARRPEGLLGSARVEIV